MERFSLIRGMLSRKYARELVGRHLQNTRELRDETKQLLEEDRISNETVIGDYTVGRYREMFDESLQRIAP